VGSTTLIAVLFGTASALLSKNKVAISKLLTLFTKLLASLSNFTVLRVSIWLPFSTILAWFIRK